MTNERDIVERLADCEVCDGSTILEAASEITRLRSELEAEREACMVLAKRLVSVQSDTKKEVDLALAQFGYDDLRFADVRHGGLSAMVACEGIDNPLAAKAVEGARK